MSHPFYQLLAICMSSLVLCNCNNQTDNNGDPASPTEKITPPPVFEKLVGTWQSENGKNFERWTRKDDGTYQSDVYSINGTDTSWKEQAHIYPENGSWIYANTVKDQNEGKTVKFSSTILTESTVQFNNPAHDFPTDINYTVPDQHTLNAFIIGPNDKGGRDTIPFNSKRVQ